MMILPVIDLMAGQVVRGIGGRRDQYRPIISQLTDSSAPLAVAQAFDEQFGMRDLYLADLDAIRGAEPSHAIYGDLQAAGFNLWIDAGVRSASRAFKLAELGLYRVVIGLETIAGPDELAAAVRRLGERVIFSLDLRSGRAIGELTAWGTDDAAKILDRAVSAGVSQVIVLDVSHVGIGGGIGTEQICRQILRKYPRLSLYAGGGVRGLSDLLALKSIGIDGALVASALHDGRLTRAEIAELGGP